MNLAIQNGRVLLPSGETMDRATVLVQDGKIMAVGRELGIPDHSSVIDAEGQFVTPGIIDVHTHLGVQEQGLGKEGADVNETSSPVTPQVRALDGINPREEGFTHAIRSGITTVQIMPGSANVIGGEMVAVKTYGSIVDKMVLKSPSGMKSAFGENPKSVFSGKDKIVTRMGIAALFRQEFMKAQDYMLAREKGDAKRDLGLENLAKVLRREIPLRSHAHRADDIVTVLRLAEEFDIEVTIEHCTEGQYIAEYIAEKGVRVSVGPTMSSKSKVELANKGWHTLVELSKVGVPVSITTDHPVVNINYLMTSVATAVKYGLDEKIAWKAVTLNAAHHVGVADRVGSLEPGKDADIVIWSGNPLDIRNDVRKTIIDGQIVYEADVDK